MQGLVFVERSIFSHDIFADEPFTEREAWLWLVMEAAWKPRRVRLKSNLISIERGQLTSSLRFMAERWKWGKNKVARFLKILAEDGMILVDCGTAQNVITICNYDKYQSIEQYRGTEAGQTRDTDGTVAGRRRDKQEHLIKPDNKEITPDSFDEFWALVPSKKSKGQARKAYKAALKKVDAKTLADGMKRYASEVDGRDPKFIKHPSTWLTGECWEDEQAKKTAEPERTPYSDARVAWHMAKKDALETGQPIPPEPQPEDFDGVRH